MSHKLAKLIKRQYQASKSASSKYLGRRLGDRPLLPSSIANVTTGTFAVLILAALVPVFLSSGAQAKSYSMTVTIDHDIVDLSVSPSEAGTFAKSSNSTVSVSTTNASGYTLSIASSDRNDGRLVNSTDDGSNNNGTNGNNYLSSIDSAITEEQFKTLPSDGSEPSYNNQWGYMPSMWDGQANTLFRPSPTKTGHVLDHTTTANPEANKYTLAIGARVDTTQRIGSYSNTYVVLATANGTPYTITYKDDTITNFPTDESATAEGDKVAISNLTPVKDGYTFLGWCSVSPTNNNGTDTCSGTTYQPNGTWTIDQTSSTNSLTLYAMWSKSKSIEDLGYMQDFASLSPTEKTSVLELMETGRGYYLMDSRDREVYMVAKLKDGNVWMRDNLRLGSNGGSIALTPSDTNISSNWTLPAGITSGFNSGTAAQINAAYKTDVATHYGQGSGKVGVYYNYCAASAGTACAPDGAEDAGYDICPVGWRLPTGGDNGEYGILAEQYSSATATEISSFQYDFSTPLSGRFRYSAQYSLNSSGYWWTSTHNSGDGVRIYILFVEATSVAADREYFVRDHGFPIRCILK